MPKPVDQATPNELLTYEREKRGLSELRLATSLEKPVSEKTIKRAEQGTANTYPEIRDQLAELLKPEVFKKNRKEAWRQLGFVEEGEIPFWHIEHAENPIFTGREEILSQLARVPTARNEHRQKRRPP